MKHIVVDLEMNGIKKGCEAKKIWNREIIEIGAVMLDDSLNEVSSFRTYVKPQYNDGIQPHITKLTGITDEMVEDAPCFETAFRMFTNWCNGTGDEIKLYAWSTSDFIQVSSEIKLKNYIPNDSERQITDIEWEDFQKQFDNGLGFERQLSLQMALDMAGIDFSGREHDALDDARSTAKLMNVFRNELLYNTTLKKIADYMTTSSMENSLGSMFDFSALLGA